MIITLDGDGITVMGPAAQADKHQGQRIINPHKQWLR
jgi:hypothetical protein